VVGFCAVLAAALSLGVAPISSADPAGDKKKVDADIAQLRTALQDTSQDLAGAFVQLQRTNAELSSARRALAAADATRVAADRRNDEVATALALAQAKEVEAAAALARNARASERVRTQLANSVRDDYQQGGISGLAIALEANSPEDFTNRMVLMDTVLRVRGATLRELHGIRVQGQAAQANLAAVRRHVVLLKVQAEQGLARAAAARAGAAAAKTKLDLLYAAQTRHAATVAARKATELASLTSMQAESDSLARVLAARAKAAREAAAQRARARAAREAAEQRARATTAREAAEQRARAVASREAAEQRARQPIPRVVQESMDTGLLSYPAEAPVSSEFGQRFHPIWKRLILHAGIDFAANCGAPIHAAADGVVILATPESGSGGYGNRLVIDHGLLRGVSLTTTYNHLTSFVVTTGPVAKGELVAYSGTTGSSTGCHLHFETREDGTPVNPRDWL